MYMVVDPTVTLVVPYGALLGVVGSSVLVASLVCAGTFVAIRCFVLFAVLFVLLAANLDVDASVLLFVRTFE